MSKQPCNQQQRGREGGREGGRERERERERGMREIISCWNKTRQTYIFPHELIHSSREHKWNAIVVPVTVTSAVGRDEPVVNDSTTVESDPVRAVINSTALKLFLSEWVRVGGETKEREGDR